MPQPPKPEDQRARNKIGNVKVGDWIHLPLAGRTGRPPAWPLELQECYPAYRRVWVELWKTPMALMWEQSLHSIREVALYVMYSVDSETDIKSYPPAARYGDRIGMTPAARLKLHWVIDGEAQPASKPAPRQPSRSSRYAGLHVVDNDAVQA